MKKAILFALAVTFVSNLVIAFILTDRDSEVTVRKASDDVVVTKEDVDDVGDVEKTLGPVREDLTVDSVITIVSVSIGNRTVITEDRKLVETVETLFSRVEKLDGIVNMENPDIQLQISYEDGSKDRFQVWVGKSGESSTVMRESDSNTAFKVPSELTDKLIELME